MISHRPVLRVAGALVALMFAVQITLVSAVYPCMAHDMLGSAGRMTPRAAHGGAAAHLGHHAGMAPATSHGAHAGMPGMAPGQGDDPAHHDAPCTCCDCACCSDAVTLPTVDRQVLAVMVVAAEALAPAEPNAEPTSSAHIVLPPSIGPPVAPGLSLI